MSVILIHLDENSLRVRKEAFGCTIFDAKKIYAEGNNTIYDFLELISKKVPINEIYSQLSSKYNIDKKQLINDFIALFIENRQIDWFNKYLTTSQMLILNNEIE